MRPFAIETRLPPHPEQLARRLWQREAPMLLWTRDASGPSYLSCDPAEVATGLDPEPTLGLDPDAGLWGGVPRWVGVLPYEAERSRLERPAYRRTEDRAPPLVDRRRWWRYPAVAVVGRRVTIVGESQSAALSLLARLSDETSPDANGTNAAVQVQDSVQEELAHRARVERALEHIRAGDIYQVNLARRLELSVRGSALALLEATSERARAAYSAALCLPQPDVGLEVVSTSPELFLRLWPDGRVLTEPIKGTRPRGACAAEDERLRRELSTDPKEQAELMMVVDVERNDLGRVARVGSVVANPPFIRTHRTLFHRQAQVSAVLRSGIDRTALLSTMLPSGSITGAPKIRAMELIGHLESERRGLYTGALGALNYDGGLNLAMAIRTLCRRGDVGHYFVGGGIVYDSVPEKEVLETRWKAAQLHSGAWPGPP